MLLCTILQNHLTILQTVTNCDSVEFLEAKQIENSRF